MQLQGAGQSFHEELECWLHRESASLRADVEIDASAASDIVAAFLKPGCRPDPLRIPSLGGHHAPGRGSPPERLAARRLLAGMDMNWSQFAQGRDSRCTLRLQFLPMSLCRADAFHVLLKEQGLSEVFNCARLFALSPGGSQYGSALVDTVDADAMVAVAKFFHGRCRGRSLPIRAVVAEEQGAAEVKRAFLSRIIDAQGQDKRTCLWNVGAGHSIRCGELDSVSISTAADDESDGAGHGATERRVAKGPAAAHAASAVASPAPFAAAWPGVGLDQAHALPPAPGLWIV